MCSHWRSLKVICGREAVLLISPICGREAVLLISPHNTLSTFKGPGHMPTFPLAICQWQQSASNAPVKYCMWPEDTAVSFDCNVSDLHSYPSGKRCFTICSINRFHCSLHVFLVMYSIHITCSVRRISCQMFSIQTSSLNNV